MSVNGRTVEAGILEQLTLPELIDVWAEDEIYRRLQEVDLFSTTIVREAQRRENLLVMPPRSSRALPAELADCNQRGIVKSLSLLARRELFARPVADR